MTRPPDAPHRRPAAPPAGARLRVAGLIRDLIRGLIRDPVRSANHRLLPGLACSLLAAALAGCATPPPAAPPDTTAVPQQPLDTAWPALEDGWHQGAFMEVFVRAYADSDGDGIGDLRGLTARLDHLQALGVRGLWLMPVTANGDGDHGYATTDFRAIAPEYGSLADFDTLLREARARGIGVVMDYVINHAADAHPMFQAARQGPHSPWRDWFVWQDTAPRGWSIWGQDPWYPAGGEAGGFYFATFGAQMPDFNFRHPPVWAYHQDSLRFWLNRGLAGYRLDAVPHLVENNAVDWNDQPESRALTREIQHLVKAYPGRYTVCEATAKPLDYAQPGLCGAAFGFGLETVLVKAAKGDAEALARLARDLPTLPPTLALFLANHDRFAGQRPWDQFGGDQAAYRIAAATYLLLPGTPFLYYGEEIGQSGVSGQRGDRELRGPMSWTPGPAAVGGTAPFSTARPFRPPADNAASHHVAAQQADPRSLLHHYRALLALRNAEPAIRQGRLVQARAEGRTLSFQRVGGGAHFLMAYNPGADAAPLPVDGLPPGAALVPAAAGVHAVGTEGLRADAQGRLALALPARSFGVWRVQPGPRP